MKRSGTAKFPNSVELFKFCQKVLSHQRGDKVHDQEIGAILNFNPSDCSHWKRGEKNVKSVFALAKLAEVLGVEISLVHDVAGGLIGLDEAFFEYRESQSFREVVAQAGKMSQDAVTEVRGRVTRFVEALHSQSDFQTPPLYLPEVMRYFSFIKTQPIEMVDKLSRILRIRAGSYAIHFRKGDLRPQTRLSIANDIGRIIFEGERGRFPELGTAQPDILPLEEMLFAANFLVPKAMLLSEMAKLDARKNVVAELATLFWVPKSLVGFQLQDILRAGDRSQLEQRAAVVRPQQARAASPTP